MDLPLEVLVIIFSYLTPNDIMEASAVCKLFYHASRKNKLFVKKLDDSKKLFKVDKLVFNYRYGDIFLSFSNQLFVYLEKHVYEDNFFLVKDFLMERLYRSVLPFRVWNHLFLWERPNSLLSICEYCSKLCITSKKISNHTNNNLFVHMNDFPRQLRQGFSLTGKIPLFVHTNIVMESGSRNCGGICYESISSQFLL